MDEVRPCDNDNSENLLSDDGDMSLCCGQAIPSSSRSVSVSSSTNVRKRSLDRSGEEIDECSSDGYETVINKKKTKKLRKRLSTGITNHSSPFDREPPFFAKEMQKSSTFEPSKSLFMRESDNSANEIYFEVSVSATKELPGSMAFAKLLKEENVSNILRIVRKSPFKILIRFGSNADALSFISNPKFCEMGFRCQMTNGGSVVLSYGILRGVDIDLAEEDICKILECDVNIISVKRLRRLNEKGIWVPCETVRVCFQSSVLPKYVHVYGCRFQVWNNTFPVTQCSGCWKFGHFLKFCPIKKLLCPKCGAEHNNCNKKDYKCLNCKGDHIVLDKRCPIFLKEKTIKELMSERNISYKQALQRYAEEKEAKRMESREFTLRNTDFGSSDSILSSTASKLKKSSFAVPSKSSDLLNLEVSYSEKVKSGKKTQNKVKQASQVISYPKYQIDRECRDKGNVKQASQIISHPKVCIINNEKTKNENREEMAETRSEKFEFKRLLLKLKEVFMCEVSFKSKLLAAVNVVLEEFMSFLRNVMSSGKILEGFLKLFNG